MSALTRMLSRSNETSTRFAAKGKADRTLDIAQAQRATSVTTGEILGALGEDTLLTPPVDTPQPADMNAEYYRATLPWEIGDASLVSTVHP